MSFFKRFSEAFNNSKIEYAHSLPVCNDNFECIFFFEIKECEDSIVIKAIKNLCFRNIKEGTMKFYSAEKIIPKTVLDNVIGREIQTLISIDEELDLEDKYCEMYEKYYEIKEKGAVSEHMLMLLVEQLKKIPSASKMLNIYLFLFNMKNV